jgi:hypothetical protein
MVYFFWSLIFTNVALFLTVVHYLNFVSKSKRMFDSIVDFASVQQGFNKETITAFEKLGEKNG